MTTRPPDTPHDAAPQATETPPVRKPRLTPAAEAALQERKTAEANALRANLLRRKAQARARAADEASRDQPARIDTPAPETDSCP